MQPARFSASGIANFRILHPMSLMESPQSNQTDENPSRRVLVRDESAGEAGGSNPAYIKICDYDFYYGAAQVLFGLNMDIPERK